MRITELFTAQSIALDEAAADQAQIIDRLVELQATHGNITDREAYKKALYAREAEASTYVDNGITVPHARTACVTRPSLAAMRLAAPVQYNAEDDGKPVIFARVDDGIHKPEELIKTIVHGEAPIFHAKGGAPAAHRRPMRPVPTTPSATPSTST